MNMKDSGSRRLFLICAFGLLVLTACAGGGKGRKGAKVPPAAVTAGPTTQAISTRDIAIWSRDEKLLDGAWMRTQGMTSKTKLAKGITFSLMATDRSQKPLTPPPSWVVSNSAVASVVPSAGPVVTLTVLKAGKSTITVNSGSRSTTFSLEASADGAKLSF